eukprot:TRINITY_DN81005_c0_g1_i1.p1 TRINITY_DN81005_c0_g1~~TRINITY_DN81005_c0_g1_i1.p1  ORF type:complete len:263 (-),score=48.83 TRINITY_DN81005_c0_g1_i1:15-755(-)
MPASNLTADEAAAKIQAMHRGQSTRQSLSKQREQAREEIELATSDRRPSYVPPKPSMEPVIDLEREESAIRIQAAERGRQARKKASLGASISSSSAPAEASELAQMEEEQSAIKIQKIQRGRMARQQVEKTRAEAPGGALTITRANVPSLPPRAERKPLPDYLQRDPSQSIVTDDQLRDLFEQFDTDGSGFISRQEFKRIYRSFEDFGTPVSKQDLNALLKKYKVFDDGIVTYQEFALIMLTLAKR